MSSNGWYNVKVDCGCGYGIEFWQHGEPTLDFRIEHDDEPMNHRLTHPTKLGFPTYIAYIDAMVLTHDA